MHCALCTKIGPHSLLSVVWIHVHSLSADLGLLCFRTFLHDTHQPSHAPFHIFIVSKFTFEAWLCTPPSHMHWLLWESISSLCCLLYLDGHCQKQRASLGVISENEFPISNFGNLIYDLLKLISEIRLNAHCQKQWAYLGVKFWRNKNTKFPIGSGVMCWLKKVHSE